MWLAIAPQGNLTKCLRHMAHRHRWLNNAATTPPWHNHLITALANRDMHFHQESKRQCKGADTKQGFCQKCLLKRCRLSGLLFLCLWSCSLSFLFALPLCLFLLCVGFCSLPVSFALPLCLLFFCLCFCCLPFSFALPLSLMLLCAFVFLFCLFLLLFVLFVCSSLVFATPVCFLLFSLVFVVLCWLSVWEVSSKGGWQQGVSNGCLNRCWQQGLNRGCAEGCTGAVAGWCAQGLWHWFLQMHGGCAEGGVHRSCGRVVCTGAVALVVANARGLCRGGVHRGFRRVGCTKAVAGWV